MSKLYFVVGTMGSGKSTQLIAKDYNYRENGKKNPHSETDNRHSKRHISPLRNGKNIFPPYERRRRLPVSGRREI